jgi:hypothetical protein
MGDKEKAISSDHKQCHACAELVLLDAKKCRYCGEFFDNHVANKDREMGILLSLGILILPHVFTWFTLREGHSKVSRVTAFSWLAIIIFFQYSLFGRHMSSRAHFSVPTGVSKVSDISQNPMGIWSIKRYVDAFGGVTTSQYISNSEKILGTFNNSATTKSRLSVDIFVDSSKSISLMLYEYSGNNAVKSYGRTEYNIIIKDKDGVKSNLDGSNYSDRIVLSESSSKKVHSKFVKGGTVSFFVSESNNSITNYSFEVDSNGYSNAFGSLFPTKK